MPRFLLRLSPAIIFSGNLFLLFGCSVSGPEYHKPEPQAPAAFKGTTSTAATVTSPKVGNGTWWQVFNDSALNQLESAALSANPQIAGAIARIDEARARLGLAAADRQPTLSTTSTAQLLSETSEKTLPLPQQPIRYRQRGDNYRVPFDVAYEVDLWGRVRRAVESAGAQAEASEQDLAVVRLTLSADVAQAWFNLRALDAEIDVLHRALALRREQVSVNDSRFQAGLTAELDLQRSKVELAGAEAELADVSRRREETVHALALLTGKAPSDFTLPSSAVLADIPPAIPAGLPSQLLQRRPDVITAERTLAARTADIGVAQAARFPTLRLTGSAGFESADFGALLNRPSQFFQVGPSLSYPLLDGGRTKANIQIAEARLHAAVADYQQKVLVAFRETEDALVDLRLQDEQAAALARALAAAQTASALSRARYEKGLVNYLEVIDAQRTELSSERSLVQLGGARRISTVRLIKALGGDWSEPAP